MPDAIATSADYADALLVARRAKKALFLLILLMLLLQITFFFVARYTDLVVPATTAATTRQAATRDLLRYFSSWVVFFGTVLPMLLAFDLLLIVNIMLVGRLIGVARVTSAFLWCLLLATLLFPVQVFFGGTIDPSDFRLPGLLYTWDELVTYAKFPSDNLLLAVLKWARFFAFPLVAVILLLVVQIKSNRGLRQALGEGIPLDEGRDLKVTL